MIPMTFASRPRVRQIPFAGIAWSSLLDHLIRPLQDPEERPAIHYVTLWLATSSRRDEAGRPAD
jgi:hypothetical protein